MTREEQIALVATEFNIGRDNVVYVNGFKAGAQWADQFPNHDYYQTYALDKINLALDLEANLAIAMEALEQYKFIESNGIDAGIVAREALEKIRGMK